MDLTKDQVKQRIIEEIDKSKEQIINFAKDIAENAETGYREIQTAKKVKEIFSQLNLNFTDGHAITGVKASPITGRSSGPTIAVIGELDSERSPTSRQSNECSPCLRSQLPTWLHVRRRSWTDKCTSKPLF